MLLLATLVLAGLVGACPPSCVCKWKGGKQTVECVNKSLITLPQGMDPGTQVLDFAGNNLDRLLRERFQRMGLINLQKIFMPRCRIKHIEERAFKGLTNLVELDLSDNSLTAVPTETFYDYPSLMRLFLSGNPINSIKAGAFQPLSFLTNLELSHCDTETVEDGAFVGLPNLEWLKLDNNKLGYIKGAHVLPENLHGIDLHHNPWQCDCRLLDLRAWLVEYNVPHSIEPTCSGPERVRGDLVRSLSVEDLACLPDISPTTLYLEIAEGKNTSLLCRVSAVPEARVSWWFQGNVLQNDSLVAPGLHLYYFVEEGTVEKTSELFIFNANVDDNGTFVCVAENQAGRTHSNYTVRIILKEEPVVGLAVFPYEYVVTVSAAVSVIALLLAVSLGLCLAQCRRQKRRKRKKERSKVVLQNRQQEKAVRENEITRIGGGPPICPKVNGVVTEQEMMVYATGGVCASVAYPAPPGAHPSYQERNPDLINDTDKDWAPKREPLPGHAHGHLPPEKRTPAAHHLTADVHLSPGKFIGADGYPVDYGLPKLPHYAGPGPAFYRTLPHKPRHSAANPVARFCREAEFLSFESYAAAGDVRYTAEGYPRLFPCPEVSPPAPYRSDAAAQWPESGVDSLSSPALEQLHPAPALTESPDEGYEGEPTDI